MPSFSLRGVEIVGITMLLLWYGWIANVANGQKERPRDRCNKTVDIFEKVQSPLVTAKNKGQPLLCWYKFRVKTADSNSTMDKDWIISIRFFKFKVGRLVNSTSCADGYIQIIDGKDSGGVGSNSNTNEMTSRQSSTGYFCGEADHPNTLISETSQVKVVFSVDHFTEETYFAFDTRGEQQFQLFARHGQNPQLYPGRRGRLVTGTICDRIFEDCRLGTCYIQSPGYPGVYPRQLRCRYYVRTASKYIRLYTENEHIDIDGQRCSDIILCPVRPVVAKQCPYDQVQIYDGLTETSPLVGTFCGRGKFPYSIIGSGRELLIVFITSPAGPLLSTGFNFHVGPYHKWIGPGATMENGSCDAVFHSSSHLADGERRFHSLSTWYPPNTKCSFTILGEPDQVIRLRFKNFRVTEQQHAIVPSGECSETLTLYDSHTRDDSKLITTFCDTWSSPVTELEDFVSSGAAMFVQFTSLSGSYFASSLDYWVQFDFFNAFQYGTPVDSSQCDERFTPSSPKLSHDTPVSSTLTTSSFSSAPFSFTSGSGGGGGASGTTTSYSSSASVSSPSAATISSAPFHPPSPTLFLRHGVFSSPLNNLVFRKKQPLNCRYSFDATGTNLMARVLVTFTSIHFTPVPVQQCISCQDDQVDKILIADPHDNSTATASATLTTATLPTSSPGRNHLNSYCLCDSSLQSRITNRSPITFLSTGPSIDVTLMVDAQHTEEYFARVNVPIFQGTYEFLHGYACGAQILDVQNQGELMFPNLGRSYDETVSGDDATSTLGGGSSASSAVRCIWTILISSMRKDVYMRFEHVNIKRNCSTDRIEIRIPDKKHAYGEEVRHTVCGSDQALDFPIIPSTALTSNRILVEFRSLHVVEQSFKLVWTELSQVQEHQSKFTSFQKMEMAAASTECAFVCEGSNTCIPQNLVCNGVRNCPVMGPYVEGAPSADEDLELCRREESSVNWLAIGLGAAGGAVLATCFILIIHRCCKKCRDSSDPG